MFKRNKSNLLHLLVSTRAVTGTLLQGPLKFKVLLVAKLLLDL